MSKLNDVLDEVGNAKTTVELIEKFIKYARKLLTKKRQKMLIDEMFREILKGQSGDLDAARAAMRELDKLGNTSREFEKARSLYDKAKTPAKKPASCG